MAVLGLQEALRTALQSLVANPLRSALTILGVVIGNASFVAMASLGEAARLQTVQRIEAFHGPNRLLAYATTTGQERPSDRPPQLYLEDALALGQGTPAIRAVAPVVGASFLARVGADRRFIYVTGTTDAYLVVKNEAVARGRFFSAAEVERRERVAVLGSGIASRFFPQGQALGGSVRIADVPFRVIGVMRPKGSLDKTSPDDFVYVPLSTFSVFLRGTPAAPGIPVDYIELSATSKQRVDDAIFQAGNVLMARRGQRDFAVAANIPYRDLLAQVSSTLTIFLAILAAISLLIGGIGIMNVMLVTVRERTPEIGLRKAVGASSSMILLQFLVESTLLSAAGGVIGLLAGVAIVLIVVLLTPLPFVVPLWSLASAVGLSSVVGVVFGVAPALQAARLDPIVALRQG